MQELRGCGWGQEPARHRSQQGTISCKPFGGLGGQVARNRRSLDLRTAVIRPIPQKSWIIQPFGWTLEPVRQRDSLVCHMKPRKRLYDGPGEARCPWRHAFWAEILQDQYVPILAGEMPIDGRRPFSDLLA